MDNTFHRDQPRSPWPGLIAHGTLIYPLFPIFALYGEWLLAGSLLGHIPVPGMDDPKYIDGSSWMHPIVALAFLGLVPVFYFALASNLYYLLNRTVQEPRRALRLLTFLFLWVGTAFLVASDPGRVVYWWLD